MTDAFITEDVKANRLKTSFHATSVFRLELLKYRPGRYPKVLTDQRSSKYATFQSR